MDPGHRAPDTSQRISHFRAESGLTQTELARLVGVSDAAVSRWESGENHPTVEHLHAIAAACQVTMRTFYSRIPVARAG